MNLIDPVLIFKKQEDNAVHGNATFNCFFLNFFFSTTIFNFFLSKQFPVIKGEKDVI